MHYMDSLIDYSWTQTKGLFFMSVRESQPLFLQLLNLLYYTIYGLSYQLAGVYSLHMQWQSLHVCNFWFGKKLYYDGIQVKGRRLIPLTETLLCNKTCRIIYLLFYHVAIDILNF